MTRFANLSIIKIRPVFLAGIVSSLIWLSGCASITNDAYVPVALSFSDGSSGRCSISNKRMSINAAIPSSPLVRRSDDLLWLNCVTEDGRRTTASVRSTIGAKLIASAVFLDFGITDAITDKHREYPASFVIPVRKAEPTSCGLDCDQQQRVEDHNSIEWPAGPTAE